MVRTLAAPLLVVLALIIAAAPAAGASTVGSQRAQAAAVMHHLDQLQTRRDVAAAHEATARAQLATARAAEATTAAELAASRRSLESAQSMLAQELVATYKNGGGDPVAYVLAAGSFSDLLSRVDVLRRADSAGSDLITQISATQRTIQAQEQAQQAAVQQAATAAQGAATARTQLDTAIAGARAVLAHVNANIQTLLAGERKRRTQLADAHGDGGTGSSTGSGGSGGSGGGSQPPSNVFYGESTWVWPRLRRAPHRRRRDLQPERAHMRQPVAAVQHAAAGYQPGHRAVGAGTCQRPRPVRPRRARPVGPCRPDRAPVGMAAGADPDPALSAGLDG